MNLDKPKKVSIWFLVPALCIRLACLNSGALHEDDFHRYRAEGIAISAGINVYTVPPRELLAKPEVTSAVPDKAELVFHLARTGYPEYSAIYPSLLIRFFDFMTPWYLPWLLADLFLLVGLYKIRPEAFLFWCFFPLVISEGFVNKHYDVLLCLPLFFCYLTQGSRPNLCASTLGAILWLKGMWFPVLLLFPRSVAVKGVLALVFYMALSLWLEPERFAKDNSLEVFGTWWEMNNPLATGLRLLLQELLPLKTAMLLGRGACLTLFVFLLYICRIYWTASVVAAITMICNPINNPWYFLGLALWSCLTEPARNLRIYLVPLGYYSLFAGINPLDALWWQILVNPIACAWFLWRARTNA